MEKSYSHDSFDVINYNKGDENAAANYTEH